MTRPETISLCIALVALGACDSGTTAVDAAVTSMPDARMDSGGLLDVGVADARPAADAPRDAPPPIMEDADTDAAIAIDAFLEPGADAGTDAAVVADDVGLDAASAADAFALPDAFVPRPDAFTAMPDAFVPRPDAFLAMPDAFVPPPDAPTCTLAIPASPTPPAIVISEIDPGAFIEVYNTTSSPIALGTTPYQLCSPFVYAALATVGAGVTVPALGFASLPWPAGFADTEAGGEVSLYSSAAYATPSAVMSFVCWGTNPHGSRKATAESGGRWSGACAGAITAGRTITRLPANDGTLASHWSPTAVPTPGPCRP